MRIELKRGSKGNLLVMVIFEEASNYNLQKHEWVPKLKEIELINDALEKVVEKKEVKT